MWGKFLNAGQTCVAPDYVLVHHRVKDRLMEALADKIKQFYGENPQISKDYGRIINLRHMQRLIGLLEKEKIVHGGQHDTADLYMAPTLIQDVDWRDKMMEDEIFGPILPILKYDTLEEMIKG